VVDTDKEEVGRKIAAAAQRPVEVGDVEVVAEVVEDDTVEEAPVKRVPTLSLPEWKRAVKGLAKAGFDVDSKSSFDAVRVALVEFQNGVGIVGMDSGVPTEGTLELLEA